MDKNKKKRSKLDLAWRILILLCVAVTDPSAEWFFGFNIMKTIALCFAIEAVAEWFPEDDNE